MGDEIYHDYRNGFMYFNGECLNPDYDKNGDNIYEKYKKQKEKELKERVKYANLTIDSLIVNNFYKLIGCDNRFHELKFIYKNNQYLIFEINDEDIIYFPYLLKHINKSSNNQYIINIGRYLDINGITNNIENEGIINSTLENGKIYNLYGYDGNKYEAKFLCKDIFTINKQYIFSFDMKIVKYFDYLDNFDDISSRLFSEYKIKRIGKERLIRLLPELEDLLIDINYNIK
jgi:hypothetical protein